MNETLKQEIVAYSKKIGIDKIGFATADPFQLMKERLKTQQESGLQSGFEKGTIDERTEPSQLLPEAKTIISIAVAYPSKMKNAPKSVRGDRKGIFCRASWGEDYHHVLRRRLDKLEQFILSKVPDAKCASMVDTGELIDRAVAERAGIGWSAKNCAIITPEFGSYVYLGDMITTIPLEPDVAMEDQCGSCNKCIDACPTGALLEGGKLDAKKCVAFLTQTKDVLPVEFRKKLGNRLYGCDTCQVVCPKNKGVDEHRHEELEPDPELVKPSLIPLLTMSNRDFKAKYGYMSGSWRGKKPIQRNAILALGNFKDAYALEDLKKVALEDPRPDIRATAIWSIAQIDQSENTMIFLRELRETCNESIMIDELDAIFSS
ncbi:tRNA epoxyqueuosine(34) reductase QueG [Paenalkalicoccus suaedae]|uniref:tRNA epoxyqueuosine(34) reductase QueG n=1 Tax=Paenalkalicoccus suaedae TaxID=2592382 RepID=A0A859FC49_9BACI|nr:tRNA epoxyqueuosine(34) reductase QueG [Paenalkalicoccus suaedae]QKS70637.1 tRNA epoxyqueuosine(34) reductase QueG [Paenalkalicoccus suaedae]